MNCSYRLLRLVWIVPAMLSPASSTEDRVLLYFSGHGFRDAQNRLYLAAVDCDPEAGGIPVGWLRKQLVACRASAKLLILDTCHAGSARSALDRKAASAKELGDFFEQTEGLVTLAACRGRQQSYIWPEKNHSFFTYWLIQGLRGNADREPLGQITINELDDYVTRKVKWSVARRFANARQQPVRLQGPNVTETVVLELQPIDLKTLLDHLAEQMDVLVRLNEIERVGIVPQFATDPAGHVLGLQYGTLSTQCPVDLANRLAAKSLDEYRVTSINATRELLQSRGISPKDLGKWRTRGIRVQGHDLPALVVGRIDRLDGNRLSLQCQLVDLTTGDILGTAGGSARLCASELAMQGTSGVTVPVSTQQTPIEESPSDGREQAQIQSGRVHPLADPDFPYRVWIEVKDADGKFHKREGTVRGKDYYVRLAKGEVYRVCFKKTNPGETFVKVLVDGLNTLPEPSQVKGIDVEPVASNQLQQAQPVNLAEAQAWGAIEPNEEYFIAGFFSWTGDDPRYDEFKVVDAPSALAARTGYTDQIGLITVAFYDCMKKSPAPRSGQRGLGTGLGRRYRTNLETYTGPYQPGRLLAVVHIRYGQ